LAAAPNGEPVAAKRWPVGAAHLDASRAMKAAAAVGR
jgi:hypothetical protein